jgi:NADPH:quinone reductase-like Zn-dependent oxidoreductase
VAGPFAETLMSCLAEHGTLMIYGGLSNQPTVFPRHLAIRGNLGMRGYSFVEMLGHPHRREAGMQYIAERLADGRFKMPIARTFPLEEIVEAHRFLESNEQVGKVVMVPW